MPISDDMIPFTPEAFKKMQERLDFLVALRVEVIERLRVAREMGDLSENGAYRYAKFELGNIGREMRRLQYLLSNGKVATVTTGGSIGFGSQVTLSHGGESTVYTLVSEHESDPKIGKLSMKSPLGAELLGKKRGDTIVVQTPTGDKTYSIEKLQ